LQALVSDPSSALYSPQHTILMHADSTQFASGDPSTFLNGAGGSSDSLIPGVSATIGYVIIAAIVAACIGVAVLIGYLCGRTPAGREVRRRMTEWAAPKPRVQAPLPLTSFHSPAPVSPVQRGPPPPAHVSNFQRGPPPPAPARRGPPPPPPGASSLAGQDSEWTKEWDDSNQLHYWFNTSTGESRWEPPEGVP